MEKMISRNLLRYYDETTIKPMKTALEGKANYSDLASVATSGRYSDLVGTPDEYILPEASDTTLGGIKVDSTSGATVEDGVLKVTQQTASGGGAIPVYIVGDTMTKGWLSLEENGTALTPVDKQEYIILSSGDWLRKHVMWMADLGVYRLAGKVEVKSDKQRDILVDTVTKTQNLNGKGYDQYGELQFDNISGTYTASNITLNGTGTVRFEFQYKTQVNKRINIKFGNIVLDSIGATGSNTNSGNYNRVFDVTSAHNGLNPSIETVVTGGGASYSYVGVGGIKITYIYNNIYSDYETDDIIDITEEEIDAIWNETAGEPAPENNVFSTEERLWGYWIDGKPIYRKTVVDTFPTLQESGKTIDVDLGAELVIAINGFIQRADGWMTQLNSSQGPVGNAWFVNYNVQTKKLSFGNYGSVTACDNRPVYVTFCYTKTT